MYSFNLEKKAYYYSLNILKYTIIYFAPLFLAIQFVIYFVQSLHLVPVSYTMLNSFTNLLSLQVLTMACLQIPFNCLIKSENTKYSNT